MPVAVEYSFINPKNILAHNQDLLVDDLPHFQIPPPQSLIWHRHIKAVIYLLTQKSRLELLKYSLNEFYDKVWRQFPYYPVVIFHDDLDITDEHLVQASVPSMSLDFMKITFQFPKNINIKEVPHRTICAPDTSSIGYRHMCRFHSTTVHEILLDSPNSKYKDVEYIMRFDDDSLFTEIIGYDLFRYMDINKKKYGFVNIVPDDVRCIVNLWNITNDFIKENSHRINLTHVFHNEWPDNHVFYNNFEISHVSIWKNRIWRDFIHRIDETKGIYLLRW